MASILPSFLLRSGLRARIRSWVREQFTYTDRADTFIDAAKPILKDAGISGKAVRAAWALGERSDQLTRLRDRILETVDDAKPDRLAEYAPRLGF